MEKSVDGVRGPFPTYAWHSDKRDNIRVVGVAVFAARTAALEPQNALKTVLVGESLGRRVDFRTLYNYGLNNWP